jgi:hypothetical protein
LWAVKPYVIAVQRCTSLIAECLVAKRYGDRSLAPQPTAVVNCECNRYVVALCR